MDVITINNKEYDPYFILNVTKDDSYEHISKSFRKKVKKYHPDKYIDKKQKEKYEIYFKILIESFEYIKNKRSNNHDLQINRKGNEKDEKEDGKEKKNKSSKKEIDNFNHDFENKKGTSDKGTSDKGTSKRIKNVEEYLDFNPSYFNPLTKKKFTNKEFNEIFEYNKAIQIEDDEDKIKNKSLIHVTTDGFNGYNSGQINDNCSLVSSYNGLLITGDDFDESGIGYWSNDYSDYKISFKFSAKNPNSKLKVDKDKKKVKDENKIENKRENKREDIKISSGSFKQEQQNFVKNTYESLLKKEEKDKEMILKHLHQYDNDTVKKALNGELESSTKYTSVLQRYLSN